ncbi:diverged AAA-family ATPase containing protein [Methanobrevibacter smithii CAG:186]|uniref:Diverged AAA-family ATPase containing protein n=1 Tax=Methanobrevibacter smithii CAG:186 TaxID=1263088 RepID=R7PTE7_METSM|nr:hypothetical protein [Methanobrevibacter smithii]CDF28625.1 diverged AAA-family ATPase containing protein [Methanobrevibacter smithii CAG:186]
MIEGHYTQKLTNGECPYKLVYFEVDLLRNIIDNPRYVISNNSFKYNISITEEYDNDETLDEKFKFILDNVGLGFDENNERIFAVLLKELSELHPEMQKRFSVYEVKKKTYIDPSYIKSMNDGEWPDPSLFSAILYQIEQINNLCSNNDVTLFKSDYKNKPPIEFNILVLPTKKEYDNFIKVFDIMLSDNINQKFFEGQIDLIEFTNKDGTKEKYKGTIALLKEWLGEIGVSQEIIQKSIKIIKKVRSQRSKPSHNIKENEFNIKYIQNQNNIILEVYNAFRLLIDEISQIKELKIKHSRWYVENRIAVQSLEEIKNKDNENYQLKICQSNQ